MNIALLIDNLELGGSESIVQRLALGLAERGHRPHVYCLRQAAIPVRHLEDAGVIVREARARRGEAWLPVRLARWFRMDRIEVAHAHCCAAAVWAFPAARPLGIPLVHVWHGWPPGRPSRDQRLALMLARHVDRVGINSESLRDRLPNIRALRQATCLPNGIDLPPISRAEARERLERHCGRAFDGPVILGVGNLRVEKDQRCLLRALARLRRDLPTVTLVCVGLFQDRAYWRLLQRERARLGLDDAALFPGPCEEAWRLMAGADVFCLSSSRESMPNVVLEAISQRVPVVATAVGDVGRLDAADAPGRLLLRHEYGGLLTSPGNPDALAGALARALRDPPASRQRAERAYEDYRRKFTTEQMVRRYERFYESCRRRRSPRRPRRRPAVLMVGPPPESLGGMVTSMNVLMGGPLRQRYALHRFATTIGASAMTPLPFREGSGEGQDHTRGHDRAITGPARLGPRPGGGGAIATLDSLGRHLGAAVDLARLLVRQRADLVHIHTCSHFTFYRNLLDLAIAKLLGRPVVLHIRGGHFEEFCAGAGRVGGWLVRCGLAAADAVIVLSPMWRERLRPYTGRTPVFAIPNAVEQSDRPVRERAPSDSGRPCRFLYLAALTRAKGLADLIEAAALLRGEGLPFELVVAGPATEEPPAVWEQRAAAAGLEGVVRFVGTVIGAEKQRLLSTADCFVHPSHCEGLPNAILEAAAAGLPVIATAVGSVPEVAQADGPGGPLMALVPPEAPRALAAEMENLARDPAGREMIGQSLRRHINNDYGVSQVSQQLARVYDSVLPRATRRGWLVRRVTYPLHEWLRGRPTLREYNILRRLAASEPEVVQAHAARRLRDLLRFAAARTPYYSDLFARDGVNPKAEDALGELRKLPALRKAHVRAHAGRMTCQDVPGGPQPCTSGGTTGDTLSFHVDRLRQAQDLAARLFMQSLFGVQPGERRVHLWGSPIEAGRGRRWRDRLLNELLLDAFNLSPERMDRHLAQIVRFRPAVLYGYTSAVTLLARHAARALGPRDFPWLRLVVLTGEEVHAEHIAAARAAFGCPVAAEYGNREVGLIAHECPRGRMHVLSPHVLVEIAAEGQAVATGECGEVLCTTLNTRAQPFLRYRVGDLGRLTGQDCPCGLPFPVMRVEGGKVSGFIALPDGRLCHGAVSSHAINELPGIIAFRTHQRRLDLIEVSLVVGAGFKPDAVDEIKRRYHRLFGDQIRVDCRLVDEIPPDPSGKRRHVISDVAPRCTRFELAENVE